MNYGHLKQNMDILSKAAASRGVSRYDLPLGPLHLLPPVVLEALSFDTLKSNQDSKDGFNRCVTVWAYIDERSGKLLDAGVERSIISRPLALSYSVATGSRPVAILSQYTHPFSGLLHVSTCAGLR